MSRSCIRPRLRSPLDGLNRDIASSPTWCRRIAFRVVIVTIFATSRVGAARAGAYPAEEKTKSKSTSMIVNILFRQLESGVDLNGGSDGEHRLRNSI